MIYEERIPKPQLTAPYLCPDKVPAYLSLSLSHMSSPTYLPHLMSHQWIRFVNQEIPGRLPLRKNLNENNILLWNIDGSVNKLLIHTKLHTNNNNKK
jgi:hypothetical protein